MECEFCNKEHEYYWVIKGTKHLLCEDHFKAMEQQVKDNNRLKNILDVAKDIIV